MRVRGTGERDPAVLLPSVVIQLGRLGVCLLALLCCCAAVVSAGPWSKRTERAERADMTTEARRVARECTGWQRDRDLSVLTSAHGCDWGVLELSECSVCGLSVCSSLIVCAPAWRFCMTLPCARVMVEGGAPLRTRRCGVLPLV